MSYLSDKVKCKGHCGELFDPDLLNQNGVCRDCVMDDQMVAELNHDYAADSQPDGDYDE